MSVVRDNFAKAAQARDWYNAFLNLNGLNMYEMLRALAALAPTLLDELLKESPAFWAQVNMPRIAFAATVVKQHKVPAQIPGDLKETGQVQDAQNFLAEQKRQGGGKTAPPATSRAGQLFPTADQAAFAAIDEILPTSVANNWEYAGRILQDAGGQFLFTRATTLQSDSDSDPGSPPAGYKNVGAYHTHAGGFFATDEQFSPRDLLKATLGKELSYVGTPRGQILRFTPIDLLSPEQQAAFPTGKVDTLRIANVLVVGERPGK
jgi:hypothetical protein